MALTVTATPMSASANSYLSVADADTLAESYSTAIQDSWLALGDDEKGRYLVSATRNLNNSFRFLGYRTTDAQALEWPRTNVARDGIYNPTYEVNVYTGSIGVLDDQTIPKFLEEATFLYAVELINGDTTATDENVAIKKLQVDGVMSIEYKEEVAQNKGAIPNQVYLIVRKYGKYLPDLNTGVGATTAMLTR
jgi:hypothetical protein